MPKPAANSPHFTGEIQSNYIFIIQTGNSVNDAGLPQMKYVTALELGNYIRQGFGQFWRFVGPVTALPVSPQVDDVILAAETFVDDGVTYYVNHLYGYNASGDWTDMSAVLGLYATVATVQEINERLQTAEAQIEDLQQQVETLSGDRVFKGSVADMASLPSSPSVGDEYWVESEQGYFVWNGTSWAEAPSMGNLGLSIKNGMFYIRFKQS
jgi:hypothetical protein